MLKVEKIEASKSMYNMLNYRSRERVKKILDHKEADRIPYCARLEPQIQKIINEMNLKNDHRIMCLEGDFAQLLIEPKFNASQFKPYFDDLPKNVSFSYWGIGKLAQKTEQGLDAGYEIFHPLKKLNTINDLKSYPFPDIINSGADYNLEEKVQNLKNQEYTVVGQMSQTILETAYNMRGMAQLMMDFYERPNYVEFLFEKIAEQRRFQARRFAEAEVDIVRIGDDIATQNSLLISPEMYREKVKPFHASIIDEARSITPDIQIKYHSDGKLTTLLPDLIDIGVTIINPVQPECMDIVKIKKEFGRDLTLWGCMPVQSTFAHGSRDDIKQYLDFLMTNIAVDGGLVVKFTNFLMTRKSLENLKIFFELFYKLGKFSLNKEV